LNHFENGQHRGENSKDIYKYDKQFNFGPGKKMIPQCMNNLFFVVSKIDGHSRINSFLI